MDVVEGLTIIGLTVRSPCKKCIVHEIKLPKSKSEFCKVCKPRYDYDRLIKSGNHVYPFLNPEQIQQLANETDSKIIWQS